MSKKREQIDINFNVNVDINASVETKGTVSNAPVRLEGAFKENIEGLVEQALKKLIGDTIAADLRKSEE